MSDERVLAILERLEARLDRLERRFEGLAILSEQSMPVAATAMDAFDDRVAALQERGVDVEERFSQLVELIERLTEPSSTRAANRALDLALETEGFTAMVVDIFDDTAAALADRGVDLDHRLHTGLAALDFLTRPELVTLLSMVARHAEPLNEALTRAMEHGLLDPGSIDMVGALGRALQDARRTRHAPVGALGLFRSLSDPDFGRALAFGQAVARSFVNRIDS